MLFPLPSKRQDFQVKLLKFPTQGTVRGCCSSRLSRRKKRFLHFYQRIEAPFSRGPGDTCIYDDVLSVCKVSQMFCLFYTPSDPNLNFQQRKKKPRDQSFLLLDEWKNTWILMCPKSSSQSTEGNGQCEVQTSPWRLHKAIPSTYLPSRALIYCSQE